MSEEKLYAVKNDDGEWLDQDHIFGPGAWATPDKDQRENVAKCYGAHVVALVEEPEKVVLSEEQAEIVERAHSDKFPAASIAFYGDDDEEPLMNAYVNGYTVANEKKYNVKVPKKWSGDDKHYWTKEQDGTLTWAHLINSDYMTPYQQFTITEIERYGLQDCEKEEVSDDEQ